jgi:hypothetical protein
MTTKSTLDFVFFTYIDIYKGIFNGKSYLNELNYQHSILNNVTF